MLEHVGEFTKAYGSIDAMRIRCRYFVQLLFKERGGEDDSSGASRENWVSLLLRISPCHQGFTTDALVNNKHQVFKAAKSINENILHEMPLPTVIREAVRASGKATLSEELYKILTSESGLAENMLNQLNLKSDHEVFKAINHLEAVKLTFDQPESEVTIIKVIHSDMPEEDRYGNAIVVENMEKG
ncbi:rop guanine nucleotide exchange factor [Cucumis melo var. makuwa]|uniref:Rop guanine nucleotide exchange factor n=1 Tax=Cucumis melo var. makuwa TaxID=1194695 RepID=A0A5A7T3F2_CUCMM|nr:rop guanine nucleotide exchange factor [Cucumis melo var. makuwa]TYK09822.1 rop guanine nucleotide exchange factor [Cucumis melo var. makuwa]